MEEFPEKAHNSFIGQQVPVTMNEMKKFLGVLLLTGTVRKLSLKMYWLTEQFLSSPVFSKIVKRGRFLLILKFFHFNNDDDLGFDPNYENRDWLHKIAPCERFRKVYQPGKTECVDESLVLFKGQLKFKQYIKRKRNHFVIKLNELATSHGITLDLLVYSGKGCLRRIIQTVTCLQRKWFRVY